MTMTYITHRRFKSKAICGPVNLPAGTELEVAGEMLLWDGKPVCVRTSENCHQYFARNDDGQGLRRGQLTQAIQRTLAKTDEKHQARWDRVWADPLCQPFKRPEYEDYWLWNQDFFEAPILALEHILHVVKKGE